VTLLLAAALALSGLSAAAREAWRYAPPTAFEDYRTITVWFGRFKAGGSWWAIDRQTYDRAGVRDRLTEGEMGWARIGRGRILSVTYLHVGDVHLAEAGDATGAGRGRRLAAVDPAFDVGGPSARVLAPVEGLAYIMALVAHLDAADGSLLKEAIFVCAPCALRASKRGVQGRAVA
jgi:hypothetical protein